MTKSFTKPVINLNNYLLSCTTQIKYLTCLLMLLFSSMGWGQTNPGVVFDLSSGNWTLSGWSSSVASDKYPTNGATGSNATTGVSTSSTTSNMRFWKHGSTDPLIATLPSANYTSAYSFASGTIYGNGTNGIGFNNTGGAGIGSAVLSINTIGRQDVQVSWTGRTIAIGARTYGIRLMYRIGTSGSFIDASTTASNIFYSANASISSTVMPTITLPSAVNNSETVQIMWYCYNESTITSGTRPTLGLDDITISSSSMPACSGTPVPGNTIASVNPVVSGSSTVLSLQNATAGTGVTYQWQSSPNNSTWTNVASSGTSATYTATPTANTYYRCNVICSGNTGTSNSLLVNVTYCASTGPSTQGSDYFTNFTITGGITNLNNSSTYSTNGYGNFTAQNTSQYIGSTVNFSMTSPGVSDGSSFGIFVDWNQDGDFLDTNESPLLTITQPTTNPSGIFTVPSDALLGNTRMRIVVKDATGSVLSCNTALANSETEDYTFTVVAIPACSGTPTAGAISSGNQTLLSGATPSNIVVTGFSVGQGITFQWQQSTDDSNWINVTTGTGATTATYTPPVFAGTTIYYRCNITCTNSSLSAQTNSVSINPCPTFASTISINGATAVSGTSYPTLTAAISSLAICGITQPTILELTSNYNSSAETFPITIPAISGASATNTLTIKPASGVTATISGSAASSALIKIASKYVTIDGSNTAGGTTRDLTITNTSTTTPNVILIGNSGTSTATALTDVTLKNTILINGVNTSSAVIVANNTSAAGYFNNITIQNNSIQKAYVGVYALATVATGNGSGLLITGNDLNTSGANAITNVGIYVEGVYGATVSNNNIGNIITSSALSPMGIWFATATNSGSISGNTISTMSYTGTSGYAPRGIYLTSGTTATSISVSNNTISDLTSSGTGMTSGIYTTSVNHTIFNNKISNIKNTHTWGYHANGIFLASTSTTAAISVYNNFIFDIAGYGWSTATDNGHGIVLYSGGGYNLYNNTINMNTNQTYATSFSSAIYIYSTLVTAASVNIRNNIFANTQTGGADVANRYAIYCAATSNTIFGTIDHNSYYSSGTHLGSINGNNRTTLNNLKNSTSGFGGNANSISVSPTFTSATDMHLTAVASASGNAALKAGTYLSTVLTDYDGETRNVTIPTIGADEIFINGFWTGTSSTAYETSGNWDDNAVPSSGANITIPTGVTNKPVLASDKTIGTLALGSGTTLSIGSNTLTINGAVSGTGTLTGSSTSNLTIGGTAGTLNFTNGSRTLKDLTLNSSATATLGTALDITAGTTSGTVTVGTTATLTTGGNLTLKSDANGTARVGNSAGTISGNVTVERYIPAGKRAFRLLSPAVTTSNYISNNWQQQTHITGGLGTTGLGFDATATNNPSMFTFDNQATSGSGWASVANTNATNLIAGTGYRVLIRGNRSVDLTAPSADAMNAAVTLSATGTLRTGSITLDSSSSPSINNTNYNAGFSLVGNPYQSPIDWNAVTKSGLEATYYAWDPNMGTASQRGRYVTFNGTVNSVDGGVGSSNVGQFIQPGQAFFVKNTGSGAGSLTFDEADKVATNANVFRTANLSTLTVSLYDPNELAIAGYPIDAVKAIFNTDYSNDMGLGDAIKLEASGENMAWYRNAIKLAIDAAAPLTSTDELAMKTIRLGANKNYTLKINTTNFDATLTPYLVDNFLNTQTEISTTQAHLATFNTTDVAASFGEDRFKIVFQPSALNADDFTHGLVLYPNPAKAGDSFYVQGSTAAEVTVYNVLGQHIPVQVKSQGNALQVTPTQTFSQGIYLVTVTTEGKTQHVKWIVE